MAKYTYKCRFVATVFNFSQIYINDIQLCMWNFHYPTLSETKLLICSEYWLSCHACDKLKFFSDNWHINNLFVGQSKMMFGPITDVKLHNVITFYTFWLIRIFYVWLTTGTCNVWSYILSYCCRSIERHCRCCVDMFTVTVFICHLL